MTRAALAALGPRVTVQESDQPRLRIQPQTCTAGVPSDAGLPDAGVGTDGGSRTQ